MRLNPDDPGAAGERRAGRDELTPVMARLGPADLETVDTLITAGIAGNRAEAVRWALARVRERPAYAQLQQKAREIGELKAQF
jgi:Arc/MetJ-type ribon-helix-helix transcriptional regulator